jgi:hypothetical protein
MKLYITSLFLDRNYWLRYLVFLIDSTLFITKEKHTLKRTFMTDYVRYVTCQLKENMLSLHKINTS